MIKLPDQFNFDLHNFNIILVYAAVCLIETATLGGRKLSCPEEVASRTSESFGLMYPSYFTLHSNTRRHKTLKHKFPINLYTTGPKEV